jgi:hypothetical protein
LFAHCNNRNPRFNGTRLGALLELVDYRNNVIYNWGGNNVYGGEAGHYNIVGNYYKYGPNTSKNTRYRIVNPSKTETIPFGKWYVQGNHVDEAKDVSKNNWLGIDMGNGGTETDKKNAVMDDPFDILSIPEQSATDAYEDVLKNAGASFRRDTLDERIIENVRNRTGRIIDVQGGYPHGTPYEQSKTAWPLLNQVQALTDTDKDGLPDEWEKKNKLDPADPSDASKTTLHVFYTNIEMYINSLLK